MADYDEMTNEEFDEILGEIVNNKQTDVLAVPGVYEILSEHFNNDVLDRWAERNPEKAHPGKCAACHGEGEVLCDDEHDERYNEMVPCRECAYDDADVDATEAAINSGEYEEEVELQKQVESGEQQAANLEEDFEPESGTARETLRKSMLLARESTYGALGQARLKCTACGGTFHQGEQVVFVGQKCLSCGEGMLVVDN
jgi:hypothetical protein